MKTYEQIFGGIEITNKELIYSYSDSPIGGMVDTYKKTGLAIAFHDGKAKYFADDRAMA